MPYALDTTGLSPSNLIIGEVHAITELNDNTYKIILPDYSPFFIDNLNVSLVVNGVKTPLDFKAVLPFIGASRSIGKTLYGGITFNSIPTNGYIELNYQTLGGEWVGDTPTIYQDISNRVINPHITTWDLVTNVQQTFPVIEHDVNADFIYDSGDLTNRLNDIATAIVNKPAPQLNMITETLAATGAITSMFTDNAIPNFLIGSNSSGKLSTFGKSIDSLLQVYTDRDTLLVADTQNVKITGNQNVAGLKTFTDPVTISSTAAGQTVTKLLLKNAASGASGTGTRIFFSHVAADNRGSFIEGKSVGGSNEAILAFGTNSVSAYPVERMRITQNGNLLINTTVDDGVDKLQVNGSAFFTSRITTVGNGDGYSGGGVELRGNGTADTVHPTLSFHQPGKYGSSLQLRANGDFRFYNQNGTTLSNLSISRLTSSKIVGTAVTQSATDTTSGRLLKVGDFGIGGADNLEVTNIDSGSIAGGLYRYGTTTSGTKPSSDIYGTLISARINGVSHSQLVVTYNSVPDMYFRGDHSGNLSNWNRVYNTGNGNITRNGSMNIGTLDNAPVTLSTNNSERARITTTGNVLIGTTTDNAVDRLQVNGSVIATTFKGALTGTASNADKLDNRDSTDFATRRIWNNWNDSTVINEVTGLLAWKNYGSANVIFDASDGTSPEGGDINNTNSQYPWTVSYPTLMGWNGTTTYGVRVDASRNADKLDGYHGDASSTANTYARRNSSGDINARLFRSEYDNTNATINYIMTQIDTATNNYIRPSTPAQFRSYVTDSYYLGITATAADSDKLGGELASSYLRNDVSGQTLTTGTRSISFAANTSTASRSSIGSTSNLHIDPPTSGATYINHYSGNGVKFSNGSGSVVASVSSSGIFTGNGSGLSSLNATNLKTGTVNSARLPVASETATGVVNTATQTFGGAKTFVDRPNSNNGYQMDQGIVSYNAASDSIVFSFV